MASNTLTANDQRIIVIRSSDVHYLKKEWDESTKY